MMMITKTEQLIEVSLGNKTLSIEADRIQVASLTAERTPAGALVNALILVAEETSAPTRIEGSFAALAEIHRTIIETMQQTCSTPAPERAGHSYRSDKTAPRSLIHLCG